MKINLEPKNASEILVDKINNGVEIEQDGKKLINKKDLTLFIKYATEQARKTAKQGASGAMVEDNVVFGWAIHFFEENEIIGKLFNLDGTEYKKPVTKTTYTPKISKPTPTPQKSEISMFDMLLDENKQEEIIEEKSQDEEVVEEEVVENTPKIEPKKTISKSYERYLEMQEKYPEYIVACRLGDFYEIYGDNAIIIAEELDLTLTGKDVGLENRIALVGFPYHCKEKYFDKIIQKHKLAYGTYIDDIQIYKKITENNVDMETGEIIEDDILQQELNLMKAFDKEALFKLDKILGNVVTLG